MRRAIGWATGVMVLGGVAAACLLIELAVRPWFPTGQRRGAVVREGSEKR